MVDAKAIADRYISRGGAPPPDGWDAILRGDGK